MKTTTALKESTSVKLDDVLAMFEAQSWLTTIKQKLFTELPESNSVILDANYYGQEPDLSTLFIEVGRIESLIPLLVNTIQRPGKEKLSAAFYCHQEMPTDAVRLYVGMLNRNFPRKSVFIIEPTLAKSILASYSDVAAKSILERKSMFDRVHTCTENVLLSSFSYLLFVVEATDGKFDFVEVDQKDREIKGKERDADAF